MRRHVFHQLYYHFSWTTKDRVPSITAATKAELLRFLAEECRKLEANVVALNATTDHVHLLASLLPTHRVSDFIGKLKGASSYHINHHVEGLPRLEWQEGYGVITLRKGETSKCAKYIEEQEQRHREKRMIELLETYEVVTD